MRARQLAMLGLGSGAISVVLWFFVSRLLSADVPLVMEIALFVSFFAAMGAAIGFVAREQVRSGGGGGKARQRKGVSKGFAIFGILSCLALAAGQLWVAFLSRGDGPDVVFFVCYLALAGGWLWRYRQATDATRTDEPEGGE